jgi:hypothetical protein
MSAAAAAATTAAAAAAGLPPPTTPLPALVLSPAPTTTEAVLSSSLSRSCSRLRRSRSRLPRFFSALSTAAAAAAKVPLGSGRPGFHSKPATLSGGGAAAGLLPEEPTGSVLVAEVAAAADRRPCVAL